MARTESQHPDGEGNDERVEEAVPAEGGTTLKKDEQTVFCSAMSPEIDRILGSHIPRFNTERPASDGHDEFYEPFLLLARTEDISMIEFSDRASDCGIPVQFLREKVTPKFKPLDYYTLLSQWVHLVLYHVKKIEGGKWPGVRPIAGEELNGKALEAANDAAMRPESIPGIEQLASDLRSYMQELLKKI